MSPIHPRTPATDLLTPRLAPVLRTRAAYRALDRTQASGASWCEGGCALLAFALCGLIPMSTVIALCVPSNKPQHLVLELPNGRYADGDGISTRQSLLRRWRWIQGRQGSITLRQITRAQLATTGIPHRLQDIAIIQKFLANAFDSALTRAAQRARIPTTSSASPR